MRENYQFNPSKRAYQTQFRRWNFPSKQNPLHRNVDLVGRVRELWERNYTHRAMVQTLNEEGYDVKSRELMRLRTHHRLLLRQANGTQPTQLEQQLLEAIQNDPEDVERRRQERIEQLQRESDERWASKKRRRRTRGYAGLPADPIGPPRFPSETTLDESKQFLSLDNPTYYRIRDRFQKICEETGVIKKTQAGPEKWQAVKNRLVQEDEHLQTVFWNDPSNQEAKALALDVVCLDVTKRMRTMERGITIAEAKNTLGLNPEQNRQMRDSFYHVLKVDGFRSITEAGERYQELKQDWINRTPYLHQLLDPADPRYAPRMRALDFICRDVVKRVRDEVKRTEKGVQLGTAPQTNGTASRSTVQTSDVQIDPSLLPKSTSYVPPHTKSPVAVYLKPHPRSQIHKNAKMWLGTLTSRTVAELHTLLFSKWSDAFIVRIEGMDKTSNGQEIPYLIEDDEELQAYLDHVEGRKAVFVALLNHI